MNHPDQSQGSEETLTEAQRITKAAEEWAEQFKTGEWFETIRKEAYIAGANAELESLRSELSKKEELIQSQSRLIEGKQRAIAQYCKERDDLFEKKSAIERSVELHGICR
jgi:hypothetical protein